MRQVALKSLVKWVDSSNVIEIWKVKLMGASTVSTNCIVLLQDQSHVCTCLLLFSEGLVCQHFFQVMLRTQRAKFSIVLIKNQWYKKDTDLNNIDTLFDSCGGLYSSEESLADDDMPIGSSLLTMNRI
ncbi:protein far1-related sequence 5-like [Gigaspora margarita]|uniref:Protein far1-related sequence 5-like n=1 Tax=Gigaspora margarita TaxID=4874 RepID=A0A8H4AK34_GIGMA|nr:protein far1-related sequence 5-like [Gigaspora margarita]